jgi:hypothetical protein
VQGIKQKGNPMARRPLFRALSPLGYWVVLTRDRWREIIRFKHPALAKNEKAVQECIAQPEVVRESVKDPSVHLYYTVAKRGHLCVVVAPGDDPEYFVVTAYFCKEIKKGRELWTR